MVFAFYALIFIYSYNTFYIFLILRSEGHKLSIWMLNSFEFYYCSLNVASFWKSDTAISYKEIRRRDS